MCGLTDMQGTTLRRWLIILFLIATAVHVVHSKGSGNLHPQLQKLYKTTNRLPKTSFMMGAWSPWSQWTPCSRTCGRGITIQSRECATDHKLSNRINPVSSNGVTSTKGSSTCIGQYKRYQLCNKQECPAGNTDYRVAMCSTYHRRLFMGRYHQWEPFLQGPKPCELNCRPRGQRFYVTLSQSVVDGTPCIKNPNDICVGGVCKHVGCDGIIGSDKKLDHCGICGGDNSTCRIVSGLYTMPQLPYGYNLVATIPRGACNVNITELKPSRNYLALRYLNGSYILNGNWAINWSGTYEAVGTAFEYHRDDDSPFSLELLTAKGPTKESIDMMVLSQHTNLGIKYEYTLPLKYDPLLNPPSPLAPPLIASSGPVDTALEQRKLDIGWRAESGIKSSNPVATKGQEHHTRHHKRRNNGKRHHHDHQHNSNNKNKNNKNSNNKKNMKGVSNIGDKTMPLSDVAASSLVASSSHTSRRRLKPTFPTNTPFAPGNSSTSMEEYSWRVTGFTDCSQTCGGGVQKSVVVCMKDHSMTTVVADLKCKLSDKPDGTSLRCNTKPCPPEWVTSEWSACSVACGNGTQSREISCKQTISSALQISVADGMCSEPPPEMTTRNCSMGLCFRWKAGEWTQCSVNCGRGVRRRDIKCVNAGGKSVSPINCEFDKKLSLEDVCDVGSCSNTWYFTEWSSQCFAICATGTQTRKVHCGSDIGLNSKTVCEQKKKPEQARSCISDTSCQQQKWFTGPWHQCSSSCGLGVQRRDVVCMSVLRGQHKLISEALCEASEKPSTEQQCTLQECKSEWYMSEWSMCSLPCSSSIQTRDVKCLDKNQKHGDDCDESRRPMSKQICDSSKCSRNGSQGDSVCEDKYHSCHLVVQSRLCRYNYYRDMCCDSCYEKHR